VQQTYSLLTVAGEQKSSVRCGCAVSNQGCLSEQRNMTSSQQLFAYRSVNTPGVYRV